MGALIRESGQRTVRPWLHGVTAALQPILGFSLIRLGLILQWRLGHLGLVGPKLTPLVSTSGGA